LSLPYLTSSVSDTLTLTTPPTRCILTQLEYKKVSSSYQLPASTFQRNIANTKATRSARPL
jgi:hypothetical protein